MSPSVEIRYERLRPAELRAALQQAPIAWVPWGALEFHGEHLPTGVDSFTSHGLLLRAAGLAGGVVLPPTYITCGTLDLAHTLTFDPALVHAAVRATVVVGLARRGFRLVVLLTGHGPLDLNHLIKRACAEAEAEHPDLRAYGLGWLELNAALLEEPQRGEPEVIDHAATVETSWMLALEPDLVDLSRLPDDPQARAPGVYGRNPRFTASAASGARQIGATATLLARRAGSLLAGERFDMTADLRRFVDLCWPESPALAGRAGRSSQAALLITNPGGYSRYLTALALRLDGQPLDPAGILLLNASPGEAGRPVPAAALGAETGFYIRREQTITATLPPAVAVGTHRVELTLGLGGVKTISLDDTIAFE